MGYFLNQGDLSWYIQAYVMFLVANNAKSLMVLMGAFSCLDAQACRGELYKRTSILELL